MNARIVEEADSIGVQILDKEQTLTQMKALKVRGHLFMKNINKFRLQLRYALMALLSEKKVLLFNDSLISLMERLIEKRWNASDVNASYCAFILDKMHFELDPETSPYENLCNMFDEVRKNKENDVEYQDLMRSENFFRQYRICVTPSLIRYARGQEEESNRVIREFKTNLHSFVRLNFMNDSKEKGYYFAESSESILGYIHKVMQHGITLGDVPYQFLSYSNSQLKSHACWFLGKDDRYSQLEEDEIEAFMGDFTKETNILKKFARKGQCFSTSRFVRKMKPEEVTFGLEDIKRNGYTFTDGVGYISPELARETALAYRFNQVSAF